MVEWLAADQEVVGSYPTLCMALDESVCSMNIIYGVDHVLSLISYVRGLS